MRANERGAAGETAWPVRPPAASSAQCAQLSETISSGPISIIRIIRIPLSSRWLRYHAAGRAENESLGGDSTGSPIDDWPHIVAVMDSH